MKVQHTATLDFTDNGVFETGWRIKQGDYGNTELVLKLVNNGVNVYDAAITPQIAFRRWDGASVISVMTPNDQTYKYAFAGNELEVPGLTLCDVKFTDAEGRVSTASCRFTVVEDTVGYDPTGAHTYDNPVSELVEQATNAAEVGIESSFKAEGFAVGEQGGVPVEEGSPYYHNNAKYYANSKSNISAIGTDESGRTTASRQYAQGEHFYKDGKFCTTKTGVAQGATWTLNTNYVEGDVASAIDEKFAVIELTTDESATDNVVLYPTGFTMNNCVILSLMIKDSGGNWRSAEGSLTSSVRFFAMLTGNNINVAVVTSDYKGRDAKLTLMKIY